MSDITRRAAAAGTAANLLILNSQTAFGSQANSAVSFGIIGTGGRGTLVGTLMAKNPGTRLAAISDLYGDKIDSAKTNIPTADKAKVYRNYKELLADKSIDAVLISTPVYLHPEHFEAAVPSGKHIYCEKPAGADVPGVLRLARAAKGIAADRVVQFGFQQRFAPQYLKAMEALKTGKIGEMKLMISYWVIGGMPPLKAPNVPWTGEEEKIRTWGRWMATSGGPIVEQDCHGIDMLNWYAGEQHPTHAIGTGGLRYPVHYGDWKTDHHNVTYFYPDRLEGWLTSIKYTADFRSVKEQLFGSKGLIEIARTYYKFHAPNANSPLRNADDLEDKTLIEQMESRRDITADAVAHFFQRIVDKKPYNMSQIAIDSTLTALMGRLSIERGGKEVTWAEMQKMG
ncbi:MAG: Gfo/Idh/MocA family oxidoreductase [Bryobacteraceae bacterium]|nr:Gfo/Idh/MocA family oxidoreductase [Bryobacteraceae bacterium]